MRWACVKMEQGEIEETTKRYVNHFVLGWELHVLYEIRGVCFCDWMVFMLHFVFHLCDVSWQYVPYVILQVTAWFD